MHGRNTITWHATWHCRTRHEHTLTSKRICSGFQSNSISFPPSQFELFQLLELFLVVLTEKNGSGSSRLVGVCGAESGDIREDTSRERGGRGSTVSGEAADDARLCMIVQEKSERQVEQASLA